MKCRHCGSKKCDPVDIRRFWTQRLDQVPDTSQWNQHRSSTGSRHPARSPSTTSMTPLSPLCAPKRSGNTRTACRGVVDQAIADPAVHKRMTGKSMFDMFGGSSFVAKATNNVGLCGCVLDAKFGPRCYVTKPLVLTRIRQDVSAGTCVAGMMALPRLHLRALPKSFPVLLFIDNSRMPWVLEHL